MSRSNYDLQVDIAAKLFLGYDHGCLIRKYGLRAQGQWLFLQYLNVPLRISRTDGHIEEYRGGWNQCRSFNTVMTVYDLLCHHPGQQPPALAGQWCTVGSFVVTGVTNAEYFARKAAAFFDSRPEALKAACQALGGQLLPPMAGADVTCRIPVTPFFPVLLQFWAGDEEFAPRLMLLWDRNAMEFLHFETTFYLQGDLLDRLKTAAEA